MPRVGASRCTEWGNCLPSATLPRCAKSSINGLEDLGHPPQLGTMSASLFSMLATFSLTRSCGLGHSFRMPFIMAKRTLEQLACKRSTATRNWRLTNYPAPVSYTHLDVYKRQAWHGEALKDSGQRSVFEFARDVICFLGGFGG